MNINEIVLKVLDEVNFEEILTTNLKESIEKTIKSSIENVYGTRYSKFGKLFEKELEDGLEINLKTVKVPQYNYLIQKAIQQTLKEHIQEISHENIKKLTEKFTLGNMKDKYNFSELLKLLMQEKDEGEEGEISLYMRNSEYTSLVFIDFDLESEQKEYLCNYKITLDKDTNKIHSLKINDKEMEGVLFGNDKFDTLLANIFLQGKKVILDYGTDPDNYDLDYGSED